MESMLRISTRETGIDEVELVGTFLEKISLSGDHAQLEEKPISNVWEDSPRHPVTSFASLRVPLGRWLSPERPVHSGKNILDIPIDILELICRLYLDTCSNTCLGLTCKAFFNITEHLYPFQVSLYTRTLPSRKCLGHLLTDWMAPKYTFDHSWGRFKLKRHYVKDEADIERRWREKESWPRIRILMDGMGAIVAYRAKRKGFEELDRRLPYWNRF